MTDDSKQFATTMNHIAYFIRYQVPDAFKLAWLYARRRVVIKCPFCKGEGGSVQGYYEPEWTECHVCHQHWDELEDHGMRWAVGRLPIFVWLRSKVAQRLGYWYAARFRDMLRCRLGYHFWVQVDDDRPEEGRVCCRCYESEKKPEPVA